MRYYRRLGFTPLREVRSDLRDMADRIVWGGEGTLMELDLGEESDPPSNSSDPLRPSLLLAYTLACAPPSPLAHDCMWQMNTPDDSPQPYEDWAADEVASRKDERGKLVSL